VATVVLDTGIVPMTEPEPEPELVMEAPGGLVRARAFCRNGKAERITITNVPSFADKLAAPLEVAGLGTLTVDPDRVEPYLILPIRRSAGGGERRVDGGERGLYPPW
jgi:hypothetical protein